ncbi:MAG: hypothetical protein EKK37_03315 [Sphingobacteriales bacterium]|nr:MAG: hypothetical protein EKK37_03315 [Sphingobacteriales bacterium]
MNFTEFNTLPESEQLELLWAKSTYLRDVSKENHRIIFYAIEDFVVQVTYHPDSETISEIIAVGLSG